ncbi:MAG: DNA phosphorothioation-associated DGQHR protein 1 [Bacteroidia bacterium]|nr:DNA phosphorothioation-associated DGQHR protein 1 [Bacteroidia bacterium]
MKPFLELPALKVNQPLGTFYVITLSAEKLLSISFSEPMSYKDSKGNVKGSQRDKDEKRLRDIARYIDSVEMAFPNSIILAANYNQLGEISKDETERWRIVEKDNGVCTIFIPKQVRLAAVIDGQHRLNAFEYVTKSERFTDLQLLCSVYFDLPNSYQAFLFATINSNQKRVDRSLALEQFGFNVDDEPEKSWTPEKFAVFLSRKLNIDSTNSPFHKHIKVAPLNPENLFPDGQTGYWVISTATIVDGITLLISSNPKRDRIDMQQKSIFSGRNREMLSDTRDYSPLREFFISGKDQVIYNTIINYFKAVSTHLWAKAKGASYINKTVGIQGAFDLLKMILKRENSGSPDLIDFDKYLSKASQIDFSNNFFQASGIGRSRVRNAIGLASGLINKAKVKKTELAIFEALIANTPIHQKEKWIWEEEAEKALINALEKAKWNYDSRTVDLYLDSNYEDPFTCSSFEEFYTKLISITEEAFVAYLPADNEIAPEMREKFDEEDMVQSHLAEFEEQLNRLGWINNMN